MGLGTLPRARAANIERRSEPVASMIWARASVKLSAELDSLELEPEPDFEPEELEPEEL